MSAKSFDSRNPSHSNVGVSKITSSQPELVSSADRESLDFDTSACASDSSSIAIPKPVASSGVAQNDSYGKGALLLISLELILLNQSSIAPFARRMDILLSFTFAVSNTSDVCLPKHLESHIAFLMAHVILNWAPS